LSWNRWHFPLRDAVPCAGVERSAWWRACGDAEHPRHETVSSSTRSHSSRRRRPRRPRPAGLHPPSTEALFQRASRRVPPARRAPESPTPPHHRPADCVQHQILPQLRAARIFTSLGPHATLRQNSLRRNTMMTAPVLVPRMLGAPRSGSAHGAHGTCGAGGPRRLQAPTPPSVAAVSVGAGSSARTGVNAQFRARTRACRARSGANLWEHSTEMASCNCGYCSSQARTAATR
jgi:hypothetical protein